MGVTIIVLRVCRNENLFSRNQTKQLLGICSLPLKTQSGVKTVRFAPGKRVGLGSGVFIPNSYSR